MPVLLAEEHWFYRTIHCDIEGCDSPVRLVKKFRGLGHFQGCCSQLHSQRRMYTTEMMDPKPVTLVVKIYDRVYNVQYPSQARVKDLMVEFATQCKGRLKPSGTRRYFICIHCGKADFSNKLMLNLHRYAILASVPMSLVFVT